MSSKKAKQRRRALRKAKKVAKKRQADKVRHARINSANQPAPLGSVHDDKEIIFSTTPRADLNITRDNYFDIEMEEGESIRLYFNDALTQAEALELFEEAERNALSQEEASEGISLEMSLDYARLTWWEKSFYHAMHFFLPLILAMGFPFRLVYKQSWHIIGKAFGYLIAIALLPLSLVIGIILCIIILIDNQTDFIQTRLDTMAEQKAASETEVCSSARD